MGDIDYQTLEFEYKARPTHDAEHHAVIVVGAGSVGLSLALDLASHGQKVVVIDDDYRLSSGSRAICFAKRTLDIWDRLGVGERIEKFRHGRILFAGDAAHRVSPFGARSASSGRLSMPTFYTTSRLNTPDTDLFSNALRALRRATWRLLPYSTRPTYCRSLAQHQHAATFVGHAASDGLNHAGDIMTLLCTQPNFAAPDDFYERLINAHRDLTTAQSHAMNAALVLLLSNHIGDMNVIAEALKKARTSVEYTNQTRFSES